MTQFDPQIKQHAEREAKEWSQIGVTPALPKNEAHEMGRVKQGFLRGHASGLELGRLVGRVEMLKEVGYALMPGHVARVDVLEAELKKLLGEK